MSRFMALAKAQWKTFYRDKATIFWLVLFPLMFLLIFGALFSGDGEAKKTELIQVGPVALFDQMPEDGRQQVDQAFNIEKSADREAALAKVRDGKADGVIEADGPTGVRLHFSQADQVRSATVQGSLRGMVDAANVAATGQKPTFSLVNEQVEQQSLKPIQYQVPGLLGYGVGMGAIFGAALTLVTWRRTELLRRMRLAPVPVSALIGSRAVVALVIGLLQVAVFLGVGIAFFGLELTRAWYMVVPLALCGVLAFVSIGLLAGAVSKSEEAASGLANLIILPMSFLSGSFIPLDMAPEWLQKVSKFLPLNWLNEGMLDTMVRGKGPEAALMPMLMLLAFGLVVGVVAVRFFRWDD